MSIVKSEPIEHDNNTCLNGNSTITTMIQDNNFEQLNKYNKNLIEYLDLFNSKYYCKVCRIKLRTQADEIIHMKYKHKNASTTSKTRAIKCCYCSKQYKCYFKLKKHLMLKHLNEKPYACKLCVDTKYTQFVHLKLHFKAKHFNLLKDKHFNKLIDYSNSKPIDDDDDDDQDVDNIENEEKEESVDKLVVKNEIDSSIDKQINYSVNVKLNCYKCKLCPKVCLNEANYLIHKWEHLINSNRCNNNTSIDMNSSHLFCWLCTTNNSSSTNTLPLSTFKSYYDLELHLQKFHINQYSYECSLCKELFYDFNLYRMHVIRTHVNNTILTSDINNRIRFNCVFCKHMFNNHKEVVIHIMNAHNGNNGVDISNFYKCNQCDDRYVNKISFNLHLKQHDFVNKMNKTIFNGTSHIHHNNNNQSHQARVETTPNNSSSTTVKIKTQPSLPAIQSKRGNSSHICNLCGYSFENGFFLNQHKSLHLSDHIKRPYKCHLCQVTFSKTNQLMRHMIVHQVNELDYMCKLCFSTFSRKQDLDRHMNFHLK